MGGASRYDLIFFPLAKNNIRINQEQRTDSAAVCKSKRLTAKIWAKYGPVKHAPREDLWVKEKKDVDAALHRERTNRRSRMVDKARKRHFRNADTDTLEARFADTAISASAKDAELTRPLKYNIPERDVVIRLTCEPVTDLTDLEKHVRSIEAIKARAALCRRQESQRRGRPRSTFKPKELMNPPEGLGVRVRANFRVGVEVKDAGVKVEVKGLYKGATCRSEQATILIKV